MFSLLQIHVLDSVFVGPAGFEPQAIKAGFVNESGHTSLTFGGQTSLK